MAATVRCMVDSRGSLRFSRRDICIWPIPSASAIFAWLIFRPFRISLRVMRRWTFASNSFPRAAIFFCRSFGREAITSSTEIIPRIVVTPLTRNCRGVPCTSCRLFRSAACKTSSRLPLTCLRRQVGLRFSADRKQKRRAKRPRQP